MTRVITHRGLDPSRPDYFTESSYEAFEDQLLRGFGLEVDVQFTKDDQIVLLHDRNLSRISGGQDTSPINAKTLAELRARPLPRGHIVTLAELLALFFINGKRPQGRGAMLAIHIKHHEQSEPHLQQLIDVLAAWDPSFIILFDLKPASAAFVHAQAPQLQLAASVAHPHDIERYNSAVGGTLLKQEELLERRELYSWAWLDEWDTKAPDGSRKELYTREVFEHLRAAGFKIALVTPELHGTSPGLLGGEAHEDASTMEKLSERWKQIVSLKPDLICTDYPDQVQALLPPIQKAATRFSFRTSLWRTGRNILRMAEDKIGAFITFHTRPMRASDMRGWKSDAFPALSRWAIVLQGPVGIEHDFTLETVRLYKSMFQDPLIILSTWAHENEEYIEKYLVPEGVEIVYNEKPSYPGPTNINFQIVSAHAGVEKAAALGAEYVIKTRTDQRIYEKNSLEFITNTLEYFPASAHSKQTKRLAFIHGLPKYAPYQFADLCVAGHIQDMKDYWSVPLVAEGEASPFFVSEVYLATSYLKKKGWKLTWTIDQLWDIYRECIVPIDWYMLDLYWIKYERHREYRDRLSYVVSSERTDLLRYSEWFNLMANPNKTPPADIVPFFFQGRIPLKIDQQ